MAKCAAYLEKIRTLVEIGHLTWDGLLGAVGAVLGGAIGAGGAALGVFWQLRAEQRRRDADASSFRHGISDELMARTAELVVLRTAIGAALEEKRYPAALDAVVYYAQITQPSLFRYAGDQQHLLTERQRRALLTYYDSVDALLTQYQSTRAFGWENTYMWPQQCEALREQCQVVCGYGAEAIAEMFGRGKEPREAELRDLRFVNGPARMGALAAIEQHRSMLHQPQWRPASPEPAPETAPGS